MTSKPTRNRAAATGRRASAIRRDDLLPPLTPAAPLTAIALPVVQAPAPPPLVIEDDPAPFDDNGFDPAEFEWRPVARRPRSDGWTPEVQVRFIEALAETGLVSAAAEAVDMSVTSCYRLRRAPGAAGFARAWRAALVSAAERLVDLAFERAIEGEEVPVFHNGQRIGARRRHNDRMATFIMRAYLPDQFRHAHESIACRGEAPPVPHVPLAEALAALMPATPADPHLLLPHDTLADLVETARAVAKVDSLYPRDDREPYVRPRDDDQERPRTPPRHDPGDYRNYAPPAPQDRERDDDWNGDWDGDDDA